MITPYSPGEYAYSPGEYGLIKIKVMTPYSPGEYAYSPGEYGLITLKSRKTEELHSMFPDRRTIENLRARVLNEVK